MTISSFIRPLLVLLLSLVFSVTQAQEYETLMENLEIRYQDCLDQGADMRGCSTEYYHKMDSMLNVVYKQLLAKHPDQKEQIREAQRAWLKRRDEQFAAIDKEPKEAGLGINDQQMIVTDKKSQVVRERVMKLIDMLD